MNQTAGLERDLRRDRRSSLPYNDGQYDDYDRLPDLRSERELRRSHKRFGNMDHGFVRGESDRILAKHTQEKVVKIKGNE
jgi:hypothetical protein